MSSFNPLPVSVRNPAEKSKWEKEYDAFIAMFPDLFPEYEEQYVAVHDSQIVASGPDEIEVAMTAYGQYGYQPIFVGRVSRKVPEVARMPAARRISNMTIFELE